MSDNTDSSPEERPNPVGETLLAELNRMREALLEKEKEVSKLQREVHKLKVKRNIFTYFLHCPFPILCARFVVF